MKLKRLIDVLEDISVELEDPERVYLDAFHLDQAIKHMDLLFDEIKEKKIDLPATTRAKLEIRFSLLNDLKKLYFGG